LVASRPGDEEKREFLASKDTWFRPVQFANGPDGNLYICDMYRETIEHPWSLPESIKKHLDLNSGNDRGRIYRIVREGFKQPARVRMGEMRTGELVGMLESGNGWTRDTAARLIYERQDKWAIGGLRKLVKESGSALGRMHGLYALEGLGGLEAGLVEGALEDESALVRRQALRVSERFADNPQIVSAIAPKLARLVNDPDAWVRYQLAFTLGDFSFGDRNELLAELAKHDAGSAWARAAILSSLTKGSGEIFAGLMRDGVFRSSREGREILQQLVVLIGAGGRADDISQLRLALAGTEDRGLVFSLARGLGEGLGRHGESLGSIAELKPILADAAQAAMDPRVDEATRVQAIELLGLCVDRNSIEGLFKLHESKSARLQTAALAALDRRNPPGLAEVLIGRWRSLTLRARSEVMGVLLKREDRCRALLRGIAAGTIAREELSSTEIRYLREYPAGSVAEPARQLFVRGIDQSRKDVVDAMMPALEMKGDGELGKKIFLERCASCHRVGEEGFALGPDLVTVKNSGKEKLLVNIVDPNREVASQYSAYLVETKEGESVLGMIGSETATSVTLRQAYGVETVIFRSNIKRLKNQGQSLMPEGLEEGLGKQGVADLVEFILK
jgi:putative heme-binding domain-containing protein